MTETSGFPKKSDNTNPFPPSLGKSDPARPLEHKNKAASYKGKAKNFFIKYVWLWIARTVRWINENNGVVTAVATAVIAALTWSISADSKKQAGAAIAQFGIMKAQLDEMKSGSEQVERAIEASSRQAAAAEEANRAWIDVATVDIEGPWEIGKDATIKISYLNTGREVATSVRNHATVFPVHVDKTFSFGETSVNGGQNNTCNAVFNEAGGVLAFPDNRRDSWMPQKISGNLLNEDVFSGDSVLVLQGCISYLSSDVLKMTGYCVILGNGNAHASSAKTPWCADGNFAK
jgi:hypothetical protein